MWIKICGIRDERTALTVADAGAHAIGLNFYAQSPRCVSPEIAKQIVSILPEAVEPVGLFVNHPVQEIREIAAACGLKTVQLHGDEPPEVVADLAEYRVIRAYRVDEAGLDDVARDLERCHTLGRLPWACLIDARVAGAYGGTGKTPPWNLIRREYRFEEWPPLILAGGLRPDNVGAAIAAVGPWGVDTSGGVESAVACKDPALVRQFVEAARRAS